MALPKLLQKLFQNDGKGPKLRPEIMPIQTVDGYAPDANGNVDTKRLPLNGGTVNGSIAITGTIHSTSNDAFFDIYGGTTHKKGGQVTLFGVDNGSSSAGGFAVSSTDGSTVYSLRGSKAGELSWAGKTVLTTANGLPLTGGTMTGTITTSAYNIIKRVDDSGLISLFGGTVQANGAHLVLYAKDHNAAGSFALRAANGDTVCDIIGKPSGSLVWGGKEIERVNSKGSNYVRFEGGLQIVFGAVVGSSSGSTVTLPVAFKDTSYAVSVNYNANSTTATTIPTVGNHTTTSFNVYGQDWFVAYIAIGLWK